MMNTASALLRATPAVTLAATRAGGRRTMSSRHGRPVFVVGVGMTKFEKPGKRDWDYTDMGACRAKRRV